MMYIVNNKVWVVFKLNMTYDDSGYEVQEDSLLHCICLTEETAKRELNKLKQQEMDFAFKNCIQGYSKEEYPNLVNTYCYIKQVEICV